MQCDFAESIQSFAQHGVFKTALWRDKVEAFGVSQSARELAASGVKAEALCAALLLAEEPDRQADRLVENRALLEMASELGVSSLVVITGGLGSGDKDLNNARTRALDCLGELALFAREANVQLVLEPLHPMVCGLRSVISTLGEARQMLDALAMDDVLGLVVDSYALWWQPDLESEIYRAGSRIRHFHVADWLPDTRDIRLDRGMPGDGIIDNQLIRRWLEIAGFNGSVEVEVFSANNWWKKSPELVMKTILQRFETCL